MKEVNRKLHVTVYLKCIDAVIWKTTYSLSFYLHSWPHSPLLSIFHSSVNRVAFATGDITLGPATQQGLDRLHTSQTAGHMERRLPIVVQLIHPRAQSRAQGLDKRRMAKEKWREVGSCEHNIKRTDSFFYLIQILLFFF